MNIFYSIGEVLSRLSINSSLESKVGKRLSNFINDSHFNKMKHIPYLNSKLTFFLKDSIGGNTKTIMITTISPEKEFYQQNLQALTFSSKALAVLNYTKPNRPKFERSPPSSQKIL